MKVINKVSYARVYCFLVETELISSEAIPTSKLEVYGERVEGVGI